MSCLDCRRAFPSGWWQAPATADRCGKVACLACGSLRCHGEGLGRGCCRACSYGRLPGWSFSFVPSTCEYKGCSEPAVYAYLPGAKKHCCKAHGLAILVRRGNPVAIGNAS